MTTALIDRQVSRQVVGLKFRLYGLFVNLGCAEMNEAAARALHLLLQKADFTAGVRLGDLKRQIESDRSYERSFPARDREYRFYHRRPQIWEVVNLITTRLMGFVEMEFPPAPIPPPDSLVYFGGEQPILDGLDLLVEEGFLDREIQNGEEIFYPTHNLLNAIARR